MNDNIILILILFFLGGLGGSSSNNNNNNCCNNDGCGLDNNTIPSTIPNTCNPLNLVLACLAFASCLGTTAQNLPGNNNPNPFNF